MKSVFPIDDRRVGYVPQYGGWVFPSREGLRGPYINREMASRSLVDLCRTGAPREVRY